MRPLAALVLALAGCSHGKPNGPSAKTTGVNEKPPQPTTTSGVGTKEPTPGRTTTAG